MKPRTAGLCLVGIGSWLLIALAARGDLWLDEIWSLAFARAAETYGDLFVRFRHDNNHVLNTLFLKAVGTWKTLYVYRLLAVLSGFASVVLVGRLAKRWGFPEALCAVALAGTSCPLLVYFSEARGYAPAILFALLAYDVLLRGWQETRFYGLLAFWAISILGLLAHTTFVFAGMAFLAVHLRREVAAAGPPGRRLGRWLAWHLPPGLFFVGWYLFFVRNMTYGGGPVFGKVAVITRAAALLVGLPEASAWMAPVFLAIVVAAGAFLLRSEGDEQGWFFVVVLVVAPALALIVARPRFLYFRYFAVCFPFFYLLLSYLIGRAWRRVQQHRRWWVVAVVLILVAGQVPRVSSLLRYGRGDYRGALARMSEESPPGTIRVGSDHDFRGRALLDFYADFLPQNQTLRYLDRSAWQRERPDWIYLHSQDLAYRPPARLQVPGVGDYRFVDEYRFGGISGWSWFLFVRKST